MFPRNKIPTLRQQQYSVLVVFYFMLTLIIFLLNYVDSQLNLGVSDFSNSLYFVIMSVSVCIHLMTWLIRNQVHKGIKHMINQYKINLRLRNAFLDGNYFNKRYYFNSDIAVLPKVKMTFTDDFTKAKLMIENININKDISDINLSYALGYYVVDRTYLSDDENYQVFEVFDSRVTYQYLFNDWHEFHNQINTRDDYTLIIDKYTDISLYGTLLVGQTGSGKTYALYSLIIQMLLKKTKYNLYFADPKNSSLAVLGEKISSDTTSTDIEDIIKSLNQFNQLMNKRKVDIKEKLNSKLEATYADFGYEPYIFIFDEFASFQTVLQTMEKKKRDEVMKLLSQVVLQGRQLGFYLWIIMQKSDATLLPTNLRENLPVKFVLGNAEKQTYTTAFGAGVDIPEKNYQLGQGVFTCPVVASTPKICHFSYLNFKILDAVEQIVLRAGVM